MIPAGRICSRALPFALALVFTAASARAELAFSPDGSHLAVSAADNRGLMVLDIHRGALSTLTDTPSSGYAFNWSPDGTKLGFKVLHATRDGYLQEPSRTYPRTPNLQISRGPSSGHRTVSSMALARWSQRYSGRHGRLRGRG